MPVDAYGKYDETIVRENYLKIQIKYLGLNVFKANELIFRRVRKCFIKKE